VAISAKAIAVGIVTKCPIRIIKRVPIKPTDPTAKPNRRNITAPNIVEIAVKKTGRVPKFDLDEVRVLLIIEFDWLIKLGNMNKV
jgi:hypothetical protein